jgi:hypothetical protein
MSIFAILFLLFLLCSLKQDETIRSDECSEPADAHGQNSSGGSGSGDHYRCACDACWAHIVSSFEMLLFMFVPFITVKSPFTANYGPRPGKDTRARGPARTASGISASAT